MSEAQGKKITSVGLKKLYRKVWKYGKRIEKETIAARSTADLFKPDLRSLRKRFCDKCSQFLVLFLQSSSSTSSSASSPHKVEELVWKWGFYEVVHRCKQHCQALVVSSSISQAYSEHISTALKFYEHLLCKIELEFGVHLSSLSRLNEETFLGRTGAKYLKDLMYRVFIHLGDLARYQVSLGGSSYIAVSYYHQAITLEPLIGTAFNQLAVLSGNKNECFDSIYYYQRSVSSPQPFSGSEANLFRLFEKNRLALKEAELAFVHIAEPAVRVATKRILLLQFIDLQNMLYPGNRSVIDQHLRGLCDKALRNFKHCLELNSQTFRENCQKRIPCLLSESRKEETPSSIDGNALILPAELLLKFVATSILPSYSLRQLGSTLTPVASAFALAVFSQLLQHSFQCIAHLVVCTIDARCMASASLETTSTTATTSTTSKSCSYHSNKNADIIQALESGRSITEIFLEHNVSVVSRKGAEKSVKVWSGAKHDVMTLMSKSDNKTSLNASEKTMKQVIVDRRRKRRFRRQMPSSDEGEERGVGSDDSSSEFESFGGRGGSSDEDDLSLPDNLGEDDLELLRSLSELSTSSSEEDDDEEEGKDESKEEKTSICEEPEGAAPFGPARKGGGKRQIILAANFSMVPGSTSFNQRSAPVVAKSEEDNNVGDLVSKERKIAVEIPSSSSINISPLNSATGDNSQLQDLMKETDCQSAVYTSCFLLVEDKTLMALRLFTHWLYSYPIVFATCTQSSTTVWSRIAQLLNILPTRQEIASSNVAGYGDLSEQKQPLMEDVLLRGFAPLVQSQELLDFGMDATTVTPIEEVCYRICSLQRFGHFLAEARTAPLFTWERTTEKFVGPEQRARREQASLKATEEANKKQAEMYRSKLMKTMAQRRLQSEVESLTEASFKTGGEPIFTPYLIPDANSLCTGLHIVKKLVKTEKFIFIITKAVIEALDSLKKSRESYAAREVIKFLEKELHCGNKYIQPQKPSESLQPGKKRTAKMTMQDWVLEQLVDCACYFNEAHTEKGQGHAVVTLVIEKHILDAFHDPKKLSDQNTMTQMLLTTARQNGVDLETMISFHINWSKHSKKRMLREK